MNAQEYCKAVEQKDILNKQRISTTSIIEDNSELISLKDTDFKLMFEPSIKKDYKYLVRKAIVEKIGRISRELDQQDKMLIIRSAWRSFDHQKLIWDNKIVFLKKIHPNKRLEEIKEMASYFIAPETKSMHSTGGAVDALIYDLKNDCVLNFGTNDGLNIDLNKKCYPYHPDITFEARKNRKLLIDLFEKENFVVDVKEYWHFDYGNVIWAIEQEKQHAIYDVIKDK